MYQCGSVAKASARTEDRERTKAREKGKMKREKSHHQPLDAFLLSQFKRKARVA